MAKAGRPVARAAATRNRRLSIELFSRRGPDAWLIAR
jgi:hypothetical protein